MSPGGDRLGDRPRGGWSPGAWSSWLGVAEQELAVDTFETRHAAGYGIRIFIRGAAQRGSPA